MHLTYRGTGPTFVTVHPGFVATPMNAGREAKLPFIWSTEKAVAYILAGVRKGKLNIDFPWPIRSVMYLARALPSAWYRRIGHRLA